MNYIVWQYLFIFFLIASVVCVCLTLFFSLKYRLIALIRSDLALKKDEKRLQSGIYSVDRIINDGNQYNSDSSDCIKQIEDTEKDNQSCKSSDIANVISTPVYHNENKTTELLPNTDLSQCATEIVYNKQNAATDDISSNNTIIVSHDNTGTVIVCNNNKNSNFSNKDYDAFIMSENIVITNGDTDEIKKFR